MSAPESSSNFTIWLYPFSTAIISGVLDVLLYCHVKWVHDVFSVARSSIANFHFIKTFFFNRDGILDFIAASYAFLSTDFAKSICQHTVETRGPKKVANTGQVFIFSVVFWIAGIRWVVPWSTATDLLRFIHVAFRYAVGPVKDVSSNSVFK